MVSLPHKCWHVITEQISTNPFHVNEEGEMSIPCMTNCPFCTDMHKNYIKPVSKPGLKSLLRRIFIKDNEENEIVALPTTPSILSNTLHKMKNSSQIIYNRSGKTPELLSTYEMTIMQLIASEILYTNIIKISEDGNHRLKCICKLGFTTDEERNVPIPNYDYDRFWEYIDVL